MASGTCLMGPGSWDAVIGDKEPMAILIFAKHTHKRPKWWNSGERCWDLRGTVEMLFILSRFADANMGPRESALPQAGERPRGRYPRLLANFLIYFAINLLWNFLFPKFVLTFETSSDLFVVTHILLKMTHLPCWGGPAGNETAVTLYPTWILTQEVLIQPRARPPIPDLHFRAAETVSWRLDVHSSTRANVKI